MYRNYLCTVALGLLLAVLVAALPAANNKREGIGSMLGEIAHIPEAVVNDKDISTQDGVGQATVITPSSTSAATPTPTVASSSAPVQSSATPTAKAQHAAQSSSPAANETAEPSAKPTAEPSKAPAKEPSKTEPEPQPKASPTAKSDEEKMNPFGILKSVGKFLGLTPQ